MTTDGTATTDGTTTTDGTATTDGAATTDGTITTDGTATTDGAGDELVNLLLDTAAQVKVLGEAALEATPLSLLSARLLSMVEAEPGITVTELSRRVPKTQQAISQVAAQLAKLDLLERRLGPGRGVGLHVTGAGRRMAEDGAARGRDLRAHLGRVLGEDRCRELEDVLRHSSRALQAAPTADAPG